MGSGHKIKCLDFVEEYCLQRRIQSYEVRMKILLMRAVSDVIDQEDGRKVVKLKDQWKGDEKDERIERYLQQEWDEKNGSGVGKVLYVGQSI